MQEIIEKIKSTDTKTLLIYSILILGIIISIFMFNSNDEEDSLNVNDINIEEKNKSVYSTKKEALRAKYGEDSKNTSNYSREIAKTDLSDITDDEDALLLATQRELEENPLNDRGSTPQYSTPTQQPKQVIALQQTVQEKEPIVQEQEQEEQPQEQEEQETPQKRKKNRFYEGRRTERKGNTLSCVVHGEQELMNGSTVKLRLLDEYTTADGTDLQRGTTMWGVCSLSKDRMFVTIQSVLKGKDLIPVNFIVYDIDGLQGINLPNNVKAEIAKRAKAQALQNAATDEVIGNDGILEKSANAVVNTTKNILSRKQEEIKITVKSNYKLVLKPENK